MRPLRIWELSNLVVLKAPALHAFQSSHMKLKSGIRCHDPSCIRALGLPSLSTIPTTHRSKRGRGRGVGYRAAVFIRVIGILFHPQVLFHRQCTWGYHPSWSDRGQIRLMSPGRSRTLQMRTRPRSLPSEPTKRISSVDGLSRVWRDAQEVGA